MRATACSGGMRGGPCSLSVQMVHINANAFLLHLVVDQEEDLDGR